jgi:O-methyltransferase
MQIQVDLGRVLQAKVDTLVEGVHYTFGTAVEGDIAEFGTMTGSTAEILAYAVKACEDEYRISREKHGLPRKRLHLFDSFQGLPTIADSPVDQSSPHGRSGEWQAGRCKGGSPEQVMICCSRFLPKEDIVIYKGWFKDTLGDLPSHQRLALLHMDCDLYSSAMDVLVPLLSRKQISEGALILFDDWNCNRASPSHGERHAWAECVGRFHIEYSDEGSYGSMCHKFIVHNYV